MPLVDIQGLSKSYLQGGQTLKILNNLDLTIERGEFVAVMGASGSGKSSLLNVLGCLDSDFSGEYFLNGLSMRCLDDNARSRWRSDVLGFVFQSFNLLPQLTVFENVALPYQYSQHQVPDAMRVDEVLSLVGLGHRHSHTPSQLSGGEMQRVAIARAIVRNPSLILADEPTGNLDAINGARILDILSELNKKGCTILLVTHDAGIAKRADRTLVLTHGCLAA